MNTAAFIAIDLVAVALLATIYFARHHRRDLVVAFLGINVGVLAVTSVLATSTIGAGLGLGLFGVLSIIRLRSSEIAQHEVAYYFAALALGLLAGLGGGSLTAVLLMGLILAVIFVADHPRPARRHRSLSLLLDRALVDEAAVRDHLEALLNSEIVSVDVQRVDLVNDTTAVEVRYRLPADAGARRRKRSVAPVAPAAPAHRGPALEQVGGPR